MADNVTVDNGTGTDYGVATDKVTYSGDADQSVQLVRPVGVTGAEGSRTVIDPTFDAGWSAPAATVALETTGADGLPNALLGDMRLGDGNGNQGPLNVAPVVYNGTTWDRARGNTEGAFAQGNIAHDTGDAGNPVKIGGFASTAAPTAVTAGDRVNAWFTTDGRQVVVIAGTGGVAGTTSPADGASGAIGASVWAENAVYNGSTWDRMRGDTTGLIIQGTAAHASPTAGNPLYVAGRASTAVPTDVGADGDAAGIWTNRNGAPVQTMAPHVGLVGSPWNLQHIGAQYSTAQTSTVLLAGGASDKIVVTKVQIQAFATTAGTAILYFGTGAYSRGTSRAIFDGEFAPSATLKPGVVLDGPFIAGTNGDDILVTTTNSLSITFSVWYYIVT